MDCRQHPLDAQAEIIDSLSDMLDAQQRLYRRSLWNDQDVYVEIWLEKDGSLACCTR